MINPFRFPFYPILLGALFPVVSFADSVDVFPVSDFLRPSIFLGCLFVLTLLLSKFLLRDWHRAGLLTYCLVSALFAATQNFIMFGTLAMTTLLVVALQKGRMSASGTVVLNFLVITQIFGALYRISPALFIGEGVNLQDTSLNAFELNQRPSIIHIVLDGYSSRKVLSQVYSYNNTTFEDTLGQRGFTVMKQAFSPHNQTLFAMASVFGGTYVETANLPKISNRRLRLKLGKAISQGAVPNLLRAHGYQFAYADTSYGPLQSSDGTLRVYKRAFPLNGFESRIISKVWPSSPFNTINYHNALVRSAFEPNNFAFPSRPFFYFQHVLSPHPPFSLTADGKDRATISPYISDGSHFVQQSAEKRAKYVDGYVEKLQYTNEALLRQLANLPSGPIVVIVHGDHGGGANFDQYSLEKSCALERYGVLFAVYSNIPKVQQTFAGLADESFNLTNTYRVLFSALSNTEIEQLPDISYFNPWSNPRALTPVPPGVRAAPCN